MKDFKHLGFDIVKMKRRILTEANNAVDESADYIKERAKHMSSGTYSLRELAKAPWFHPYSVSRMKHFVPNIPYGTTAIINRQSGTFYRAWQTPVQSTTPEGIRIVSLKNDAPYAHWLEDGTKLMVKRPIGFHTKKAAKLIVPAMVSNKVGKALQTVLVKK